MITNSLDAGKVQIFVADCKYPAQRDTVLASLKS